MWKLGELDPVDLGLLERGIVDIRGEIDGKTALHVREALLRLVAKGTPALLVQITSDGGNVDIGLDIYDALRLYSDKKTGRVVGYARSMAVVILQACQVRECARNAHILIHHVTRREVSLTVLRDKAKLHELKGDMERAQTRICNILVERTGKNLRLIREACRKESDMSAKEAKEFGLVDEIV